MAYHPLTQLGTHKENRVHYWLFYFLWTFDRREREGGWGGGWQKDMLSVVKEATSVPAEALLSEWSGVAWSDLGVHTAGALCTFTPYAVPLHVAFHMEASRCVAACHAELLLGK